LASRFFLISFSLRDPASFSTVVKAGKNRSGKKSEPRAQG
jgi:hypothetical protein